MTDADQTFEYDVFISYRSSDRAWVKQALLGPLESKGVKACIDYRDFPVGMPTVKCIEEAILKSKKTLLVLSPAYLESRWTAFENILVSTLDPSNQDFRLLPLLKEKCELPLRIKAINSLNFAEPEDEDIEWRKLLTALGKSSEPETPEPETPTKWHLKHPYPMPSNFTGREQEQRELTAWLNSGSEQPLYILRALGGFGKSALTWYWLNHAVEESRWPRVVWWSFYEQDASFQAFVVSTLNYLGVGIAANPKDQVERLLDCLRNPEILLVLDGFERELRAYSGLSACYQGDELDELEAEKSWRNCCNPLADAFLKAVSALSTLQGKVLMTTRLLPRAVEVPGALLAGCKLGNLGNLSPSDGVAFFQANGIRGTRAELEAGGERYGFHPLSLRLLAGGIVKDLRQAGDIRAAQRIDVSGDLVQRQNHVLQWAYENLDAAVRQLLSRIACFRSPVTFEILELVSESATQLEEGLQDLLERGLVYRDFNTSRFDLHPIVRRYAYDRLGQKERAAEHQRLANYFEAVSVPATVKVERLEDLTPAIEFYHHLLQAKQFDQAIKLFDDRLASQLYFQLGAYRTITELLKPLFVDGESKPPCLSSKQDQGWTVNELGNSYALAGQPHNAIALRQVAADIYKSGNEKYLAITLSNLVKNQIVVGSLQRAERNLNCGVVLCQEKSDERGEAIAHHQRGLLNVYLGNWATAHSELQQSDYYWEQNDHSQGECLVQACHTQKILLQIREDHRQDINERDRLSTALSSARRTLDFAEETARTGYPVERDFVQAYWLLGAAHCVNDNFTESETHLTEALTRCRRINLVEYEAGIILDLARLRAATNNPTEAQRLAQEALDLSTRCEYVLQSADIHLFLAQQASDPADIRHHAEHARDFAYCDGPPYCYRVAYEEALALLE
ncbi:MAG: TIR domain-containing protein [Cyanobacteria bacterium P01_H01_bin.15]